MLIPPGSSMRGSTAAKLLLSCLALCSVIWSASQLARHPSRLRATVGGWFPCFSPDGELVVTQDKRADDSICFRVWDVMTGRERITLASDLTWVSEVMLSNDKKLLAARDHSGGVRLWNIPEGKQIAGLPGAEHSSEPGTMVFSPDSEFLAVQMRYKDLQLFRTQTGEEFTTIGGSLATCAFAPSGKAIAFAEHDDSILKLWNLAPGQVPREREAHGTIERIAFAPDGRTIAALVSTGTGVLQLKLWNADNLDEAGVLGVGAHNPDQLYFSPDSRLLVAVLDGVIAMVWNLQAERPRQVFEFR
ncbi:MAG TPA: hypothetical protein VGY58_14600, partial [Gemmataceae bacterium]|nr:hypothetical protein [Gemmataceae bacterium]